MTGEFAFYTAFLLLAAAFSTALWADWHRPLRRILLTVAGLVAMAASLVSFAYLKGMPRNVDYDYLMSAEVKYEVFGVRVIEGTALYVLIAPLGEIVEPIYYMLPWDERTAKLASDLLQARNRVNEKGGRVIMEFRYEKSLETREPMFYDLPMPALPPKPEPEGRAEEFEL